MGRRYRSGRAKPSIEVRRKGLARGRSTIVGDSKAHSPYLDY